MKALRITAGIVAYIGFNAFVAAVQTDLTPAPFWSNFGWDLLITAALLGIVALGLFAVGFND